MIHSQKFLEDLANRQVVIFLLLLVFLNTGVASADFSIEGQVKELIYLHSLK